MTHTTASPTLRSRVRMALRAAWTDGAEVDFSHRSLGRRTFVRVVDTGRNASRTTVLTDAPAGLGWPWSAGLHATVRPSELATLRGRSGGGAMGGVPEKLRRNIERKVQAWGESRVRLEVASDLVVECELEGGRRLWLAVDAQVVLGYRHRRLGATRVMSAVALLAVALAAPFAGLWLGLAGWTLGGIVTTLIAVSLVTRFHHGDGGANAWAKVR